MFGIEKIKTSAATFQVLLYFTLLVISFPITSCLSIPIKAGVPYKPVLHSQPLAVVSAADPKPGDLRTKYSSVPMCLTWPV